jgi:hypothetical protein
MGKGKTGCIANFRISSTANTLGLLSVLLFFPEASQRGHALCFKLGIYNLSKKVSKPCLPARQERTPPTPPE